MGSIRPCATRRRRLAVHGLADFDTDTCSGCERRRCERLFAASSNRQERPCFARSTTHARSLRSPAAAARRPTRGSACARSGPCATATPAVSTHASCHRHHRCRAAAPLAKPTKMRIPARCLVEEQRAGVAGGGAGGKRSSLPSICVRWDTHSCPQCLHIFVFTIPRIPWQTKTYLPPFTRSRSKRGSMIWGRGTGRRSSSTHLPVFERRADAERSALLLEAQGFENISVLACVCGVWCVVCGVWCGLTHSQNVSVLVPYLRLGVGLPQKSITHSQNVSVLVHLPYKIHYVE